MAARRTRIKGIANIPQRRKNIVSDEKNNENDNLTLANITDEDGEDKKQPLVIPENTRDEKLVADLQNNVELNRIISKDIVTLNNPDLISSVAEASDKIHNDNIKTFSSQDLVAENTTVPELVQQPLVQPKPVKRRTFIKPLISASVINRKPKQNVEKDRLLEAGSTEKTQEVVKSETISNSEDQQTPLGVEVKEKFPIQKELSSLGHEATLNEIYLTPQGGTVESEVHIDKGVKKILPQMSNTPSSDTEYPPPPPSPSKINRSRIKAIPRLGYRKTSFSASESEDESKRNYNRNRNDSVCSTASGIADSITDCMSPQKPKDFNSVVQKKCIRTEHSRKLAEARRDFQRRFGSSKPDRQRLTMIDLIFYNPSSNPMTNEAKSNLETDIQPMDTNQDAESENIDDPQPENTEEVNKSDEENEMPVPQIKIGPMGEIILDEKSLVIENKEVKKQKEELQKTKLVDGDFDTGYGIYKRQKRSKEWTPSETVRLYKALNTIGTDFTLMCEFFPGRTRRELKQKFKKEEKVNRTLVDKALMQPCSFDYAELKHEVDMEEKELEELRRQKEEEQKLKKERIERRQLKKRKAVEQAEMEAETTQDSISKPPVPPKPPKIRKTRKPRQKKFSIESILEDSDADVSDIATQSESEDEEDDEEVLAPLKATRSGRIPKVTKKFDVAEECSIENIMKKNKLANANTNDIQPGSIMIITETGPNGEPVYKIYMVTADKNATPLKLNSEVVSRAIQFKKGISAENIGTISTSVVRKQEDNEPPPVENNITIPADENVTTLRGKASALNENIQTSEENVTLPVDGDLAITKTENVLSESDSQ